MPLRVKFYGQPVISCAGLHPADCLHVFFFRYRQLDFAAKLHFAAEYTANIVPVDYKAAVDAHETGRKYFLATAYGLVCFQFAVTQDDSGLYNENMDIFRL